MLESAGEKNVGGEGMILSLRALKSLHNKLENYW